MIDIDKLYRIALENAERVKDYKKRFAYAQIEKLSERKGKQPAILLSGLRGVGKTTLMLQFFRDREGVFYFSADSILVKTASLYSIVENIYRQGYHTILIDEIHTYPRWVEELKNIYDDFDVSIIASGSSTAAIRKGSMVLGRRTIDLHLPPLTFAEFYYLRENERCSAALDEALDRKAAIRWLASHPKVEKYYKEYLKTGGFPLPQEKGTIFKLARKMIYEDAIAEFSLTEKKVDVAQRLLGFLSLSKPGEFSYTSFSSLSGYAKSTLYETVNMLIELSILRSIKERNAKAQAKEKIKLLFYHPNLRVAFAEELMSEADLGALREEYFLFHAQELGLPVFLSKGNKKNPDYELKIGKRDMLVEIGGRSKTQKQFEGREGVLLDDENLIVFGFVRHNVQKTDQK